MKARACRLRNRRCCNEQRHTRHPGATPRRCTDLGCYTGGHPGRMAAQTLHWHVRCADHAQCIRVMHVVSIDPVCQRPCVLAGQATRSDGVPSSVGNMQAVRSAKP